MKANYTDKISHRSTHIHTHKKRKRGKNNISCSQSPPPQFGMICCLFNYSSDAGISSWLWSFNLLLLRLLGETSLSLLCSPTSCGSALDLAPSLHVGRLWASVLYSGRTGLKEQLLQGLWVTQAGGREGYGCRASLQWQRPVWHCTSLRCAVCSPAEFVPGSQDPGSGVLHRLPGHVDSDLCLHTGFLVAAAAPLGFHAHLWCPCW